MGRVYVCLATFFLCFYCLRQVVISSSPSFGFDGIWVSCRGDITISITFLFPYQVLFRLRDSRHTMDTLPLWLVLDPSSHLPWPPTLDTNAFNLNLQGISSWRGILSQRPMSSAQPFSSSIPITYSRFRRCWSFYESRCSSWALGALLLGSFLVFLFFLVSFYPAPRRLWYLLIIFLWTMTPSFYCTSLNLDPKVYGFYTSPRIRRHIA